MSYLYTIASYIGYFWILLIFLIVAIIFAKKTFSWILYGIGAFIQLIALYGTYKSYSFLGAGGATAPYWVIYILFLIVAAVIISKRRNN